MFLDTSGLLAYFDRGAAQHVEAQTLFLGAPLRLLHSYVLAEFVPLCHVRGLIRADALRFVSF